MDYDTAVKAMNIPDHPAQRQGMTEIRRACDILGEPQNRIKTIHIAGTNGKGSTAKMMQTVLENAGYRVGLFTSPSLYEFNERIRVNETYISDADIARYSDEMREQLVPENVQLSEFEWFTVLAFWYFYRKQVDVAIIEVGLGGLLDATNVIDQPLVSVITHIGYDHMEILGETIEAIAEQKAGIIKSHVPVVCYPQDEEVMHVIRTTAESHQSEYIVPDHEQLTIHAQTVAGQTFDYKELSELQLNLLGDHQIINAITAIETLQLLHEKGIFDISSEHIHTGIRNTRWPGRMEGVNEQPLIIVDGAHNPQGIEALAHTLKQYYSGRRIIGVTATMKEKAINDMIPQMAPLIDEYYVLSVQDLPRSLDPSILKEKISAYSDRPVHVCDSVSTAFEQAMAYLQSDDLLLCYGSLYLISDFREEVTKWQKQKEN